MNTYARLIIFIAAKKQLEQVRQWSRELGFPFVFYDEYLLDKLDEDKPFLILVDMISRTVGINLNAFSCDKHTRTECLTKEEFFSRIVAESLSI